MVIPHHHAPVKGSCHWKESGAEREQKEIDGLSWNLSPTNLETTKGKKISCVLIGVVNQCINSTDQSVDLYELSAITEQLMQARYNYRDILQCLS